MPTPPTAGSEEMRSSRGIAVRVVSAKSCMLTTLWKKLIKIGAKVVAHAKDATFQLAEVAVPRKLFARILKRIARLRPAGASG